VPLKSYKGQVHVKTKIPSSGVYLIKCKINNRVYIGQSTNISSRISLHISSLTNGKHHCELLQEDYNKYGLTNFVFELIEEVEENENSLLYRERCWIDIFLLDNIFLYNSLEKKERTRQNYKIVDATQKWLEYRLEKEEHHRHWNDATIKTYTIQKIKSIFTDYPNVVIEEIYDKLLEFDYVQLDKLPTYDQIREIASTIDYQLLEEFS